MDVRCQSAPGRYKCRKKSNSCTYYKCNSINLKSEKIKDAEDVKAALDIFLAGFIENFEKNLTLQNNNAGGVKISEEKKKETRTSPKKTGSTL